MRSSRYSKVAAAFALAAVSFCALPAAAATPTMNDALSAIAAYAPQALAYQDAPGVSIAITDRTHTLRIITLGYANAESKTPVTPQTRFPIGSITKGMTVTALMELRDAGKFDPREPVKTYLPWFRIDSDRKTIYAHQLLSHTAGIPDDYSFEPGYMFGVAALRSAHTLFAPGSHWSYSNDGLSTAGAILAALDNRTWGESVQTRVFDRLGMAHTSASFSAQSLAGAASGYEFGDMNVLTPAQPRLQAIYPGEYVDPAGTVISTPEDMARYMRFLINGGVNDRGERVISAQSYDLMTTPDDMDGKPAGPATPELAEAPLLFQHYGFGLGLHGENGENYVSHTGGIGGYSACMETNVTRGYGVIAMSNLVEAPLHPCAIVLYAMQVLHAQALGQPLPAPPAALHGTYLQQTHIENADRFAGTFSSGTDSSALTIASDGSSLTLTTPQGPAPLYTRGGTTFWVDDPRFATYGLTFVPGKNGAMEIFSGSQWFYNDKYAGPKSFVQPAGAATYAGRYEGEQLWGVSPASRVFALKGKLTVDGAPLEPLKNGTFKLGSSVVRFDTLAGGQLQRMWIDGLPMYRIDLP